MDCLEQARTLYGEYHRQGNNLSQEKQASISTAISKLIRTSLLQQGGSASFKYVPFLHVIQRTVGANRFQGNQAAMAFLTLEKYMVLLAQQPWKREFWVLKIYGGYFCTKVRAHLEGAEEILQLVGFVPEEGATSCQRLILYEAPDTKVALNIAFDCQVASLECQYIREYYAKMKCVGLDLSDAMNVLLSGAPNDLLVGSSLPGDLGRGSALGNIKVSYNPSSMQPEVFPVASRGQGSVKSHTVLASGGMGMGLVTGVKAMHQVIGVQPSNQISAGGSTHQVIGVSATHRSTGAAPFQTAGVPSAGAGPSEPHTAPSAAEGVSHKGAATTTGVGHSVVHVTGVPALHPSDPSIRKTYSSPHPSPVHSPFSAPHHPPSSLPHTEPIYVSHPPPPVEGVTTLLAHHQSSPLVVESTARPSYIASHPSSVAYQAHGSRGSLPSSAYGYGSGSASVLSGGSSACTGSSGYCSAISSSPSHDYANLPIKPPQPATTVDSSTDPSHPTSRPHRHSQKPQFPFIQEDEMGYGTPFPEATHEEHLRESLRNLQVSHPEKTQKRPLSKNIVTPQMVGHSSDPGMGGSVGGPVTYDDWRWFRGETQDKGLLQSSCKVVGDAGGAKSHAVQMGSNVQLSPAPRPSSGHPVAPVMSADTIMAASLGTYHPAASQESWKASVTHNPVYYPPQMSDTATYNNISAVKGPPLHPQPSSTQKMASQRWEDRGGPQTYRSPGSPSPLRSTTTWTGRRSLKC
ncbi:hypothetical protein ACOMHN_007008 [Nucella lapillus]